MQVASLFVWEISLLDLATLTYLLARASIATMTRSRQRSQADHKVLGRVRWR
jgi:hypothetical protein